MRFRELLTHALIPAGAVLLVGSGCESDPEPPPPERTVYVEQAPPPPQYEVVGVAPGPDFVWIDGRYVYYDHRYVWQPGRWERRPYGNARWEGGRWDRDGRGWRYHEGRWH